MKPYAGIGPRHYTHLIKYCSAQCRHDRDIAYGAYRRLRLRERRAHAADRPQGQRGAKP